MEVTKVRSKWRSSVRNPRFNLGTIFDFILWIILMIMIIMII